MSYTNKYRTYHSRSWIKTLIKIFFTVLFLLIVAALCIFYGFQKHIVYTQDGVRLDVPWLSEDDVPAEEVLPAPSVQESAQPEHTPAAETGITADPTPEQDVSAQPEADAVPEDDSPVGNPELAQTNAAPDAAA